MLVLTIVAIILGFVLWIIMAIGSVKITDGCLYRYSIEQDGTLSSDDTVAQSTIVKANGNYAVDISGSLDPASYGKWINSNFLVTDGQEVSVQVRGEVSLCQSYVTRYNPMSDSNTNPSGNLIPIPRSTSASGATDNTPLSYIMDARTSEWKTIAEVFPGDKLVLSLTADRKEESLATQYNAITDTVINADCSDGERSYNPICGRYTMHAQEDYVSTCDWDAECYECNCRRECVRRIALTCWERATVCDWCGCYVPVNRTMPERYSSDGTYTLPWKSNINDYYIDFQPDCRTNHSYIMSSSYQDSKHFWLSADTGAGLLFRYDTSENPSNASSTGSNYSQAEIISDSGVYPSNSPYNVFLNEEYSDSAIRYLQVKLADPGGSYSSNTGGYVVNIKHTKCYRVNGSTRNDTYNGRGLVEYVILPPGEDANNSGSLSPSSLVVDANGDASFTVPSGTEGNIWLKIRNDPADYVDSTGQYRVEFNKEIETGGFIKDILNPIFEGLKERTKEAAVQVFKNMTCYQGTGGVDAPCTNFFNYLRGLLSLYIMIYGMMFLIGSVKITQTDIVTRVIKVGLVAGLMNEGTFDFFNNYIFDSVTSFSDEIIANMGGYSIFTDGSSTINNPLIFLDNVMTKVFLSTTFKAQIMALLSMGLNGILYFIIIFVTLIIMIIACLRSIAVYLMAYVAIAILLGIAPLFLSFILFSFTKTLFENWARYTFRYMIEPVIVLSGLTILVQLFTIYLDIIIGYSVCWKCALGIKIPFVGAITAGLTPAFLNVPIFCLNWFAPWGHDVNTGPMGLNFSHIAALLILAYCMWGYVDFAGKLSSRIAGSMGGPSAVGMGTGMADTLGNNMLRPIGMDRESRADMQNKNQKRAKRMIKNRDLGIGKSLVSGDDRMDRSKSKDADSKNNSDKDAQGDVNRSNNSTNNNQQASNANAASSGAASQNMNDRKFNIEPKDKKEQEEKDRPGAAPSAAQGAAVQERSNAPETDNQEIQNVENEYAEKEKKIDLMSNKYFQKLNDFLRGSKDPEKDKIYEQKRLEEQLNNQNLKADALQEKAAKYAELKKRASDSRIKKIEREEKKIQRELKTIDEKRKKINAKIQKKESK